MQCTARTVGPSARYESPGTAEESESTTMEAAVKNPWQGAVEKFSMTRIRRYVNPAKTIILKCD